jgi:neurotransmitter:Na+ symporter, NSS family
MKRESWASQFGIILAVAGSAVGLGNFLRFPGLVAQNGGGAFLIPYFLAFLLLGLPVCWIEWTMGRFGGVFGHSTAPGTFDVISRRKPWAKYLGVLGVVGPLGIFFYYVYIEGWTLAFSVFAVLGKYKGITDPQEMQQFFGNFLGSPGRHFSGMGVAYFFFLATFVVNFWVVYRGLTKGIEQFCEFAMPVLFVAGLVLTIRVLTLGAPLAAHPDWNVNAGLGFVWNPDFSTLKSGNVWLKAAGQIFFTLSVGIGCILTYSSYVRRNQDIALSSLTASSMNEFAEVIIGSSIVIVAAVCFFGPAGTVAAAQGGIFGLGFVTMPLVFNGLPGGEIFGFYWFLLLFIAGITSSISLLQPTVSFLEDEFGMRRLPAVLSIAAVSFVFAHLAIFGPAVIDEMDFWFSSLGLPLFGLIEVLIFVFVLGVDRGWKELHQGAEIRIHPIFRFVIRYITPVYLAAVLVFWLGTDGWKTIIMKKVGADGQLVNMYTDQQIPWVWTTRIACLVLVAGTAWLIRTAWRRRTVRAATAGGRHP